MPAVCIIGVGGLTVDSFYCFFFSLYDRLEGDVNIKI